MAVKIATDFELATLKVSVRPHGIGMAALAELVLYEGGTPRTLHDWWLTPAELALPPRLEPRWRPGRQLPKAFVKELSYATEDEVPAGVPLWLHLVKPSGFLGALDWEGALVPALGRPLLRLPDFLESPRENREVLDVALCCSEPVSEPQLDPPTLLANIAQAVLAGSRRPRTTIHLFADQMHFDALRRRFAGEPRVAVHDPETARQHGTLERGASLPSEPSGLRNPWLLWMRDSMRGRSLDAVHFVVHGYLADERPALALAESPLSNRDRRDARYVGVNELAAFLTQTGAWSTVFSSPPANYSDGGLRLLADTLAQSRPGPLLYHAMQHGTHWQPLHELQALYGFLYAPEPVPVPPQSNWFAYCQPAIVQGQVPRRAGRRGLSALDANARLFTKGAVSHRTLERPSITPQVGDKALPAPAPASAETGASDEAPSWVSAAQRYVEQVNLNLQRGSESLSTPSAGSDAVAAEAERTLQNLQAIIASVAQSTREPDKP
jgi:hypothetical protein